MCAVACTMIVLQQHLSQKLFCNALPRASECPSLPRQASTTWRLMAAMKVMKRRLKVKRSGSSKGVVDLISPSPKRAAMKQMRRSPGKSPKAKAKAKAKAGKGPAAAASRMRAFLAEESSAASGVAEVDDEGKPVRRCRNKMAQFEKHRKTGVITPERYNAWKAQSRAEQTKIIDEMVTYENGQYRVNLKARRYEEAFKRWERKEKGIVNQGVLLEEAETRAGGPEKLQRGVDAGRIQVDIIILHVSTNSSLYMSMPYVLQSRSCALIHHMSKQTCRGHRIHIHVNANIALAYHSHVQVDKTKTHWVYYFVTAVDSHMTGTDDVATVSGSRGVNKQVGEHVRAMLADLGWETKALEKGTSNAPKAEVSSKAKGEVDVVQCDIIKLLKSCQKDLEKATAHPEKKDRQATKDLRGAMRVIRM